MRRALISIHISLGDEACIRLRRFGCCIFNELQWINRLYESGQALNDFTSTLVDEEQDFIGVESCGVYFEAAPP